MVTRLGFVAKIKLFSTQNDDEKGSRRQNRGFPDQKRRRDWVSSPKTSISHPKVATRTSLVVKIEAFSNKNGDENGARRQN
ncbi:hypothetical protein P9386_10860 [Caldifermentibacillus hisashii]|uniref:hypothetical protein n=1 Tax=Caldifermentibacillus hisashii TaxID=996558 RepID=UPI002E1A8DF6|nr:hypothetical protein [Caldifermentibacillus hisashii]